MRLRAARWLIPLIAWTAASAQTANPLDTLYESNQWFQLREALDRQPNTPVFYRGAVELAFHQWEQAERDLRAAADDQPASITVDSMDQASRAALAMKSLADFYSLTGRYKDAAEQFDRFQLYLVSFGPNSLVGKLSARENRNMRALNRAMARYPNLSVEKRGYSQMLYAATYGRPVIPVTMSGKAASALLDSGSNSNFINPSEARRLGIAIHRAETAVDAYDGSTEKSGGFAVADELTVGNFALRHVAFFVNAEDDPESAIILGLPALFALGTIRWSSDGSLELGFASQTDGPANLAATGDQLLAEASVGGEHLVLNVDTGADETLVYPSFARALGVKAETSGKPLDRAALAAQGSTLRVAGFEARPASGNLVYTKQTTDFEGVDGNLGLDILEQGRSLTLDLEAMRLTVEAGPARGGHLGVNPARCALPPGFVCQQGFTCTVWLTTADPCTIDRVTSGIAGGSVGHPPDGCVVPANVTCGRMEICTVSADANGTCSVSRSEARAEASAAVRPEPNGSPEVGGSVAPKPNLTDAELHEMLAGVTDEDLNFEPARNYIYQDDQETRSLDAKGNVVDSHSETHESIVLYGERYEKLTAKDGKPLSAKEARSEQQKLDKESDRRKKESEAARNKRLAEDRACSAEFLASFRFHSVGVETINGRPAWRVEAEPLPGGSPKCSGTKEAKLFHLRLWIDQADKGMARIEADNIQRVTWGAVLVRIPAGSLHISGEMTRRDDGAWLPARVHARIDAKLILLKTVRLEIVTAYRDYRKFRVESKIVE